MFYEKRPKNEQEAYKQMLKIMGSLSRLFSDSETPYLYYRCHENLFCKYFDAENLSRADVSADAKKEKIGIGLKTWTGSNDQKVAEFDKLKSQYAGLTGLPVYVPNGAPPNGTGGMSKAKKDAKLDLF